MQTTPNYGLKKPDGTDAVDISKLNANADIIDEKLKENADAISTANNNIVKNADAIKNINLVDNKITVTDANNHFENSKLDGVLDELFQFANNGKNTIATKIGSPLLASDSFTDMGTKIDTLKSTFRSKLSSKNVTSNSSNTLQELINKIGNIDTGYKIVTGNANYEKINGLNSPGTHTINLNTSLSQITYAFFKVRIGDNNSYNEGYMSKSETMHSYNCYSKDNIWVQSGSTISITSISPSRVIFSASSGMMYINIRDYILIGK